LSYFTVDEKNDNTNVNFYPLKDELYASTETNFIRKVDPETLETLERVSYRKCFKIDTDTLDTLERTNVMPEKMF
jgi:hypothetical protein